MSDMWDWGDAQARKECRWTRLRGSITMNFLTELKSTTSFNDVMNIYRHACHPENVPGQPPCADGEQPLLDSCYIQDLRCDDLITTLAATSSTTSERARGRAMFWKDGADENGEITEGGFYDGAVRVWGDGPGSPALQVGTLGDLHAVGDGSDP